MRRDVESAGRHIEPRSWGDRLANKWNFAIPGLPESVEVHAKRLGQTGEHTALARRFVTRRIPKTLNGLTFLVPSPEERVIVATLQRMYRHFYFRVCDIVNTTSFWNREIWILSNWSGWRYGGIWPGVATYLKIVLRLRARVPGLGSRATSIGDRGSPFRRRSDLRSRQVPACPCYAQWRRPCTRARSPARPCAAMFPATLRLSLLAVSGLCRGGRIQVHGKRQGDLVGNQTRLTNCECEILQKQKRAPISRRSYLANVN